MKVPRISKAMEYIDEDLISEAAAGKPTKYKGGRWKKAVAIAACVAVITGSLLTAEASSGSVSNLLAPLFGVTQTDIVDKIGIPVGVSASADGYTLTVDAVIGDRYNVAVIYTLTRDDGQPITEDIYFQGWKTDIISGASGGGSLSPIRDEEHPKKLSFVELWSGSEPMIGRYVSASFSDLAINYEGAEDLVIAKGPWELNYTLRYKDSTVNVPVKDLKVEDGSGKQYQVDRIRLSPIGLHLEGILFDPVWGANDVMNHFQVAIKKADDTVIPLKDSNGGCGFSQRDKTADIHYQTLFAHPIPLDEIEAIIICGVEVPVEHP